MTATVLTKTDSATLDASGNGVVTLRPDVGQNWAPLFVRVSTQSQTNPIAHCTVSHGSPGVQSQPSQYIDDTFLGSGDTSSIISGTPILYGEAILFTFTGGLPGDVAVATVYGMTSDLPPNLNILPQVPGTHFNGHPSTEITTIIGQSTTGISVPGHTGVFIDGAGTNLAVDVRQYASYYIKVFANVPTPTAYNSGQIILRWFDQASFAVGGHLLYQDQHEWWTDGASGTFTIQLGQIFFQDTLHGPFMSIQYMNNSNDTVTLTYELTMTTRVLSGPYARQFQSIDGLLMNSAFFVPQVAPANTTLRVLLPYSYGRMWVRLAAGTGANLAFGFCAGIQGAYDIVSVAANGRFVAEIVTGKRALEIDVVNNTGVAGTYSITVFSEFSKN